ncbi:MAG: hypothetical protein HYU64_11445 [Armatimonadetes bacterium]|nr:hypothetical protein [Armatimonadota bacterium]
MFIAANNVTGMAWFKNLRTDHHGHTEHYVKPETTSIPTGVETPKINETFIKYVNIVAKPENFRRIAGNDSYITFGEMESAARMGPNCGFDRQLVEACAFFAGNGGANFRALDSLVRLDGYVGSADFEAANKVYQADLEKAAKRRQVAEAADTVYKVFDTLKTVGANGNPHFIDQIDLKGLVAGGGSIWTPEQREAARVVLDNFAAIDGINTGGRCDGLIGKEDLLTAKTSPGKVVL